MKRTHLLFAALAGLASVGLRADAYCTQGAMYTGNPGTKSYDIPVFLVAPNPTIFGFDRMLIGHHLAVAVDNWNEEGGSHVRPYYAGIVSSAPGFPTNGSVYVLQASSCEECSTYACEKPFFLPPYRVGSKIYVEQDCDGVHVAPPGEPGIALTGVFMHEFGHSLGLKDEYELQCEGIPWSSVMANSCIAGRIVTRRDIAALQSLYGQRNKSYAYRESADGSLTWTAGSPPEPSNQAWLRAGSLGYLVTSTYELYAQPMLNGTAPAYTKAWRGQPGTTHTAYTPSPFSTSRSWDVGAAAQRDATHWAVAYTTLESEEDCSKQIRVSMTDDGGASWTSQNLSSGGFLIWTKGEGVALAYEPVRDVYVAVWTDDSGRMFAETITALPPHSSSSFSDLAYTTWDHPAVACNSLGLFPNCMIAWARKDNYTEIQYATAFVDANKFFQINTPITLPYRSYQSPSLAWRNNASYPWVLSAKFGNTIYSWRYRYSTGEWIDQRTAASSSSGLLSGSLGSFSDGLTVKYVPL